MNGETSTVPIRPPPGPSMPGSGGVRARALAAAGVGAVGCAVSASSKVTTSRPSCLNAGDARIFGTQV